MESRIKLDPLAYLLLVGVIGMQIYTSFLRNNDVERVIAESNSAYQAAVFDTSDNKGVLHQIFRQNEVDRELLKVILTVCAR